MGKDVLSKIRTNDVYRGLIRVLSDYHIEDYNVRDERPHPKLIIRHVGLEKEFEFPGTPRRRVNVKSYVAKFRRFLQDMQMEALEMESRPVVPSKVGQVHVPMQGSLTLEDARNPVVFTMDGEVFANSRDIAEFFGKRHEDVVRAIRNLTVQEPSLKSRNFAFREEIQQHTSGASKSSSVDMDRDGFTLLAMGFTGSKALKWKMRYIEAFNAMETELRRAVPIVDLNDPAWLRGQLLSYTEKVLELQETVAAQKPKVEALGRIAEADGSLCITDAAKTLQVNPSVLFKWLDRNGWTYARVGSSERRAYQTKLNAGYLEHKVKTGPRPDGTEWCSTQVRVTPKGLAFLAEIFPPIARVA